MAKKLVTPLNEALTFIRHWAQQFFNVTSKFAVYGYRESL